MSIPVHMDQKTFRKIKRELLKEQDIVLLDSKAALAYNLVAYHLTMQGTLVKANLVKREAK